MISCLFCVPVSSCKIDTKPVLGLLSEIAVIAGSEYATKKETFPSTKPQTRFISFSFGAYLNGVWAVEFFVSRGAYIKL